MDTVSPKSEALSGAVLVVGGGVAGVQASLDLTGLGYKVYLVEKSAAIGGAMARLDKTFPTNDCSLCILAPKLVEAGREPNIEIITNAELTELNGEAGSFTAHVRVKPRFIDQELCTGCGQCTIFCPRLIPDDYNENLQLTKAAHIDYAQAVPANYYIDADSCMHVNNETCGLCANVCQKKAISFDQKEVERQIEVGAVILAPGFGRIKEEIFRKYGWGRFEDVLTAFEFERLMCASGPTSGDIVRISNRKHPKRIAFLQCIGSRDVGAHAPYCSSVCCMYAIKQATMAREHDPDAEITLFYMDMRTQGKGFDAARERAIRENNLKIVYARPSKVEKIEDRLCLTFVERDGSSKSAFFDMVILAQGLAAPDEAEKLAEAAGIKLNPYHFAESSIYEPLSSSKTGVYVIGAFQGPKDIPESVTQAEGAAGLCASLLMPAQGSQIVKADYPVERDVSEEEPRVGVFVCHCGINIGGVVKVPEVARYAATLPNVVYASDNLYSCSQDAQKQLVETIRKHNINRVVVSACTPRTHEPLFQATIREAGLNRSLFEMANIRDQCSWVHMHEKEAATQKAKDLVRMAVAKSCHLTALAELSLPVTRSALVVGGGVSGLTAALSIADQGYECVLVEREERLGGQALKLTSDRKGGSPREQALALAKRAGRHERIRILTKASVASVSGYVGNFTTTIATETGSELINHGVIVLATGGRPYIPTGRYLYGESRRVMTQIELEERLTSRKPLPAKTKQVAMIQCVGSMGEDLSYCSRVCCGQAVKNALRLKKTDPDVQVVILYRDMRTYGFMEDDYREARRQGVIFLRCHPDKQPHVTMQHTDRLSLTVYDDLLGEELTLEPDMLVLSTGIVPEDVKGLAGMLKLPVTADGFFLEAHVKLRPVDLPVDGVYVCGLAHSPRSMDESIAQALAASAKACQPLAKGNIKPEPIVSHVNEELCIGCGACEQFCPYNAIRLHKVEKGKKAQTVAASCKGCGVCASRCPTLAIDMGRFTYDAIMAQIHAFSQGEANE